MDLFLLATAVEPDTSLTFTLTVIIAGLGIVLATLAVLIVIFNAFGKAVYNLQTNAQEKKAKRLQEQMQTETAAQEDGAEEFAPLPPMQQGTPPEVVAAISAAVYMMEGSGAVIRSIRRKAEMNGANAWAQAAVRENTRPF